MWKCSICAKDEAHLYETSFVLAKTRLTQEQVSFLDGTRLSKVASYSSRQVPFIREVCVLCKQASWWGRVLFFLAQMALIKPFLSRLNWLSAFMSALMIRAITESNQTNKMVVCYHPFQEDWDPVYMEWGIPVSWGWILLSCVPKSVKTKETNPTRPGSTTPCKQAISIIMQLLPGSWYIFLRLVSMYFLKKILKRS